MVIEIADEIVVVISKMDSFIKELRKGIDKTEAVKNDIKREQRRLNNGLSSDIIKAVQGDVTKILTSSKSILDIMVRMSINLNTGKTEFINADKNSFDLKALHPKRIYRGDEPSKENTVKANLLPNAKLEKDILRWAFEQAVKSKIESDIVKSKLKVGDFDGASIELTGMDVENVLNALTMGEAGAAIEGFQTLFKLGSKGYKLLKIGITGAKEALSKLTVSSVALAFTGAKGLEQIEETAENIKKEEGIIKTALESAKRKLDDLYKIVYDGDGGNKKSIESKTLVDEGKQFNNGRKNKLKPNIRYKTGEFDYFYETDNIGRIEKFETDNLKLTERSNRLPHSKNTPGKLRGKDNAGHLAGDRFGGSPKIDNLVSQLENVNKSQYKKIENQWAKALEEGKQVKVKLDIKYEGNSMRPSKFNVQYEIGGEFFSKILLN
ncbi:DNA/RNA non-specific endonuclease [Clostridium felsineum]|uniref:DNA/RNA non-specific endonuclease n=1 Tax=Clostridium felsineum TaxID=36839 RepID=UPI00214D2382|nr:DNA/RNA non-specific endonuclease [Clostridium felsineum]MCR3757938.1 DNA/RNA non-specific endonuclease [Clostridium felsineum]